MIGKKVIHKVFGTGTVVGIRMENDSNFIDILFDCGLKKFVYPDAFHKYLIMEDPSQQLELEEEIQRFEDEKKRKDKELERQRREAEQLAEQTNERKINRKNQVDQSFERLTDDKMFFIVFQNQTFNIESQGNYLWAPVADLRGVWCHFWRRLTQLRKGDVIFHCCNGEIKAASVVQGPCYKETAPNAPMYSDNSGKVGNKVDTLYSIIPNCIQTKDYRTQIMQIYPAGSYYAPFDCNGDGNQGYLFELDTTLAITFLNDTMKNNPNWEL